MGTAPRRASGLDDESAARLHCVLPPATRSCSVRPPVKILARYMLKEVLATFAVWLLFLFVLLFVMQFLRGTEVLLGSAVTLVDFGKVSLCLAPHFLVMAIPVALLLAILLGFGRLTEDRELVALNALGVSPLQVLVVPFAAAVLLAGAMMTLSFTLEPWGLSAVRTVVSDIIKKNVIGEVKPGVFYEDISELTLYAEGIDPVRGTWKNVLMHDDTDPRSPLLMLAREGLVQASERGEALRLGLSDGSVHAAAREADSYSFVTFERGELAVGVGEAVSKKNRFRSTREELTPIELLEVAEEARLRGESDAPVLMALHWRFGQALSPLAFALIAVPLSMSRQGGRARGYLFTIFAYVGYYLLARTMENLGSTGRAPLLISGQLGNLVFALVGLVLLWRVSRAGIAR